MAIPNDLRQMNRRKVVLASRRGEATTRSALAKLTGISQPTIGKIVENLIEDGILREVDQQQGASRLGRGRPGSPVKLDDVRPKFLAVELGVSHTRLATLTAAPPLQDHWPYTIPTVPNVDGWIESVRAAAAPLLRHSLAAVLVSVPGMLDHVKGRSVLSPNARWIEGESMAARLSNAFALPAFSVQEIACLALGHYTVNPNAGDFLLVDFDQGVGSAALVNGRLMRGPLPFSNELGHTPVLGNTAICGCGGVGCLETLVGRRYLLGDSDGVFRHETHHKSSRDGGPHADRLTPLELARLTSAAQGMRVHSALAAAGLGIAGALNVLGVAQVVITGFVADFPQELFNILRAHISSAAVAARFGPVKTDSAPRHRLAGLAALGMDRVLAAS